MGWIAAAVCVAQGQISQDLARRERYALMTPEQRAEYDKLLQEDAMAKDRTRAAQMFKAAAKSGSACPWKRFRKAVV